MPTATYEQFLVETVPEVITTEARYEAITGKLGDLVGKGRKRSGDETRFMRLLMLLVEDYDRKHSRFVPARRTPAEALKYLAKEAGIGPTAMGKVLGTTHSMASLLLHGKRGLRAQTTRALAEYLQV